jgi:phage terminase small subunit
MANQLTGKQQAFIDAYLKCYNATEAARKAGYKGNGNTLSTVGAENLRKPNIAQEISNRLRASAMSADEVLMRLGEHARSDYKEYLTENGKVDLERLLADDKGHLIKGIKLTKYGNQIEFYGADNALALIAKHHGLLVNRVEQKSTNLEIDLTSLDDEQLKRLASGEDIVDILAGD